MENYEDWSKEELIERIRELEKTSFVGQQGDLFSGLTKTEHEYVDLGLPSGTLWATCNVGANEPWEYGGYYAWGETEEKEKYLMKNSKWYEVEYSELQAMGVIDENGNLTSKYDVATVKWGEEWRMPTKAEIDELLSLESEFVKINGIEGTKFIGTNGNFLFLPFFGGRYKDEPSVVGENGLYWSATADEDDLDDLDDGGTYYLDLNSEEAHSYYYVYRNRGFTVRPVRRVK